MISDLDTLAEELVGAHRLVIQVTAGNGGVASGVMYHTWNYTGLQATVPGPPGRVVTKAMALNYGGALFRMPDPPAGKKLHIARAQVTHPATAAHALADRLLEVTVPVDATGTTAVNSVALTRQTSGRDVELWAEVRAALGGPVTMTVDYINQSGVQRTTPPITIAINANRLWQFPLASGDTGVQQIVNSNITTASPTAANAVGLVLYKDLLMLPCQVSWTERDWLASCFLELDDDVALTVIYYSGSTSSRLFQLILDVVPA